MLAVTTKYGVLPISWLPADAPIRRSHGADKSTCAQCLFELVLFYWTSMIFNLSQSCASWILYSLCTIVHSVSLANVYMYMLTLHINVHHKAYTYNTLLHMHITFPLILMWKPPPLHVYSLQYNTLWIDCLWMHMVWHILNWLPMTACGISLITWRTLCTQQ